MKKNTFGRKFKRDVNERKALFKNLLTSLVLKERIKTTEAKAKAIKSAADKLITKAKIGGRDAYRALEAEVNRPAVVKLIDDLAVRFKDREGGYTRIIKAGRRVADNAPIAVMEWVEKISNIKDQTSKIKVDKKDKPEKKSTSAKASSFAKASMEKSVDKAKNKKAVTEKVAKKTEKKETKKKTEK